MVVAHFWFFQIVTVFHLPWFATVWFMRVEDHLNNFHWCLWGIVIRIFKRVRDRWWLVSFQVCFVYGDPVFDAIGLLSLTDHILALATLSIHLPIVRIQVSGLLWIFSLQEAYQIEGMRVWRPLPIGESLWFMAITNIMRTDTHLMVCAPCTK